MDLSRASPVLGPAPCTITYLWAIDHLQKKRLQTRQVCTTSRHGPGVAWVWLGNFILTFFCRGSQTLCFELPRRLDGFGSRAGGCSSPCDHCNMVSVVQEDFLLDSKVGGKGVGRERVREREKHCWLGLCSSWQEISWNVCAAQYFIFL